MNVLAVSRATALLSPAFCLFATFAYAQSDAPAQAAKPAPLQLAVPTPSLQETPVANPDNATVDANDSQADEDTRGPQVHGSFTTGIGYSKGYGTSTVTAADVDIRGQTDSGRTYDVQIHVMQGKGPGFGPYRSDYGPRYRGY